MRLMGECLDIISGNGEFLPSNIGYKATTDNQNRLLFGVSDLASQKYNELQRRVPFDRYQIQSLNPQCSEMLGLS